MMIQPTTCKRCGGPITFKQRPNGKLQPVELDGSEHWDTCKRRQRIASGLLNSDGSVNIKALERRKPAGKTAPTRATHVWACSDIPPWDDSLGTYRDFSEEEKAAGEICRLANNLPAV